MIDAYFEMNKKTIENPDNLRNPVEKMGLDFESVPKATRDQNQKKTNS